MLLADEIHECPNMSNEAIREYLSSYAPVQYFTNKILQNKHTRVRYSNLGSQVITCNMPSPKEVAMDECDHSCELILVNWGVVMNSILKYWSMTRSVNVTEME